MAFALLRPAAAVVLLLLLLVVSARKSCLLWEGARDQVSRQDDDFCDCADGLDELVTSACSHRLAGEAPFHCKGSGVLNASIATSRVSDGVCDCCDGSDENASSPFGASCPNTCGDAALALNQGALVAFRQVQAGLRAKQDMLESWRRGKLRDSRTLDKLREEKRLIFEYLLEIQLLMKVEVYWENLKRLMLLQDRQYYCARGVREKCAFFHPEFFDIDEVRSVGYKVSVFTNETFHRWEYSDEERKRLAEMSHLERFKQTICLHHHLLPDDDSRFFGTVGELVDFMKGAGGKAVVDKYARKKQKITLFSRYLNYGTGGYELGALFLLQVLSVPTLPVTLPLKALRYAAAAAAREAWSYVQALALDEGAGSAGGLATHAARVARVLVQQVGDEESLYSRAMNALDYNNYELLVRLSEVAHPLTSLPSWVLSVLWTTPDLYFDFYFTGKFKALPPRRQMCLLREGLRSADEELRAIDEKLKEQQERQAVRSEIREISGKGIDKEKVLETIASNKRKRERRSGAAARRKVEHIVADYGPEGEWEAVRNDCVQSEVGEYLYKLCFFGDVKQNKTVIGKFATWGAGDFSPGGPDPAEHYSWQLYDRGTKCPVKKDARVTAVRLHCSPVSEIFEVREPEVCRYVMQVRTPLACGREMEEQAMRRLEQLGVFGFAAPGQAGDAAPEG